MITAQEYRSILKESIAQLDYSTYNHPISAEKVFSVNLNSRQIQIPSPYPKLGVMGDHNAETIWFVVNRYFDGIDLSPAHTSKKWAIQVINANNESMLLPMNYWDLGGSAFVEINNNESGILAGISDDDLILGWKVPYDVTKSAGTITFSLRCYILNDNDEPEYSLGTEAVSAIIEQGLNINSESENLIPSKDTLTTLVDKILEVMNGDGTIGNVDYNNILETTLPTINEKMLKGELTTADLKLVYKDLLNLPTLDGIILTGEEDFSSASFTNIDYGQLLNPPQIKVGEETYTLTNEEIVEIKQIDVDTELKDSENPVQNKVIKAELDLIKAELEGMSFVPMAITSFGVNNTLFERGYSTQGEDLIFNWELSKDPISITINEKSISVSKKGTYTWDTAVTDSTTFTFVAADAKSDAQDTVDIIFTNKVFYGASTAPTEFNETFIESLSSELKTTKENTFNVVATGDQYIYYAAPQSYGECSFSANGLIVGGFSKKATNIQVTNAYGITEIYDIYQSDYTNLGDTTIVVV